MKMQDYLPGGKLKLTSEECRVVSQLLDRIGDKWALLIITLLGVEEMRFSEMRQRIGSISQKMLTTTLRGLERDGYIARHATGTSSSRSVYAITSLGRELLIPVDTLTTWAIRSSGRILAAQQAFDQKISGTALVGQDEV